MRILATLLRCVLVAWGGGVPADVARPYEAIEKTTLATVHLAPGAMSAAEVVAQCRDLAALGIQHAIFNMPNVHEITPLETFGREIIPAVAAW